MSYSKQNFQDGDVIQAVNFNRMDNQIAANINSINDCKNRIANTYDQTDSSIFPISKGQCYWHNDNLYEAKVNISEAETWTSNKWKPVALGDVTRSQKKRNIILVGDSYGTGYYYPCTNKSQYNTPWTVLVKSYLETNENIKIYYVAKGGMSFHADPSDPTEGTYAFANIFDIEMDDEVDYPLDLATIDCNEITDIYLFAGRNEFISITTDDNYQNRIKNGMQLFIEKCKIKFPNAQVSIGMIGSFGKDGKFANVRTVNNQLEWFEDTSFHNETQRLRTTEIYSQCTEFGAKYIPNCDAILYNTALICYDPSAEIQEGVHPNQSGQYVLARYIINAILGENISVINQGSFFAKPINGWVINENLEAQGYQVVTNNDSVRGFYIDQKQVNQTIHILSRSPMVLERNTPITLVNLNTAPYGSLDLCELENTFSAGDTYIHGTMPTIVVVVTNTGGTPAYYSIRCNIELVRGTLKLNYDGLDIVAKTHHAPNLEVVQIYLPLISMSI